MQLWFVRDECGRFRNGFKYVFRWLPFITWHASDALGIGGGAKIVRLGGPSDGKVTAGPSDGNAAAGAPMTTMYRSPRDARRAISTTQQTVMMVVMTVMDHTQSTT